MSNGFSSLDWFVFAAYFLVLAISSYLFSQFKVKSARDYFVSSNTMPMLAVAVSIVATSQSAATFLGVPEFTYVHDFTFIGFYISALLAVVFISVVFVPKFYKYKVVTVYELLQTRYGESAKKQAGLMFLLGRIMASGARLYIGALAVSMILFLDISFMHMLVSIILLILGALAYTYFGGIKSIIFSDVIQAATYVGAGILVFWYLYVSLHNVDILQVLQTHNKLHAIDTSLDGKFSILALFSGWLLLNIAAFGLDQDMTQRVLSCKNKNDAAKSLILSIIFTIPIVLLFLGIGALLFVHYQTSQVTQNFQGESITIFMYYILNEMPSGLRGLVTVGAIAAALSSTNSVLGAMASVTVEDLYRPWKMQKNPNTDEAHFLKASRNAVLLFAVILALMAIISYFWQRESELSLVSFALGVMTFAYTGLLGVFFSAVFTSRGSTKAVPFALIGGFISVLALQPYTFGIHIGFAWQMVLGTAVSFLIMQRDKGD
ncbi:sodium:solute symporter [Sulfurimonas autotrophica]|uniref:Na+/solute symporter n=1 Tax=Sulfurimonas autotrophica (strain ATCC BAA-671 / DSM 16294 / JCM 11897 / OK10) TaxID=563040 RepID=E0URH6_SULAO|nr:sodium:solute symporter [Sulfurimonas autotrophica]ADN10062.1 Na+/solute symporter [Sulfurimonas autotrophica DSM 16294]